MAGFDVMGLMNDKSKTAAPTTQPKYEMKVININNIIENPENKKIYSMENIGELADAIELAGRVLHNLVVKPPDADGKYMLISGQRRWMACKRLVSRGKAEFDTVHCLVENEEDQHLQELMLIYTNSTARDMSDAEKARQAERATAILTEMKKEKKLEGRVRDIVAGMLKTTSGQLARYKAITNNLKDEDLKEAFNQGKIGVSVAYEASTLSEAGQEKLAQQMRTGSVTLQDVAETKKEEQPREDEERADDCTNAAGDEFKTVTLDLPKSSKTKIKIHILEKDGKFYAGHDVEHKNGGGGYYPDAQYSDSYATGREAFEEEIKKVAKGNPDVGLVLRRSMYKDLLDTTPAGDTKENWAEHQKAAWIKGNTDCWHFSPIKSIGFTVDAVLEKTSMIGGTGEWIVSCAITRNGEKPGLYKILPQSFKTEKEALDQTLRYVAKKDMRYARPLIWYLGELVEADPEEEIKKDVPSPDASQKETVEKIEQELVAAKVIVHQLMELIEGHTEAMKTAEELGNTQGAKNHAAVIEQLQALYNQKKDDVEEMETELKEK